MSKVTCVLFRAFDQTHREFFIDKTPVEIHTSLMNICDTYVTVAVLEADNAEYKPVSMLDQFTRPDKIK